MVKLIRLSLVGALLVALTACSGDKPPAGGSSSGGSSSGGSSAGVDTANVINVSSMSEFRQALEDAAANGENDRIVLARGTYNVTSDGLGTLTFNDNEDFNLTIEAAEGLHAQDVVLSGNNLKQIFNFNNRMNFGTSTLILKNLSIIDGNTSKNGAIYVNKDIRVEACDIHDNRISEGDYSSGAGFHADGSATIINSTISGNSVSGYGTSGAGFSAYGTTITIIDSNISNNHADNQSGGGFDSLGVTTLINSTISNNSAQNGAGFYSGGRTIIINSMLSNNVAAQMGGGFWTGGESIIVNSMFIKNKANEGAIYRSIYSSYASNNTFVENNGSIYGHGIFVNNIFSQNDKDIDIRGNADIYNNYIDYAKIKENSNNVVKKNNLQPASAGDIYLTTNYAIKSNSPAINTGINPSSPTYKNIINNDEYYAKMVEWLNTDMTGNSRVNDGTIDMGAVEY